MRVLSITLLYGLLNIFSADSLLEFPPSSPIVISESVTATPATTTKVAPGATNLIFQSTDGGQTWQDISSSMPEYAQPEGFFAGESDLYLRVNNTLYRSETNGKIPVWEKENGIDARSTIVFNRPGVTAYTEEGNLYRKMQAQGSWLPVYTTFKKQQVETVFETANGVVLIGCRSGLYKSADKGRSWKHVKNEGWVMDIVESNGILIATGEKGIMRSEDKGEHWEWVINEGGVGIDVERIDGGFAAITYSTATKSRRVRISLDNGKTWQAIDEGLRSSLSISSIKQTGRYLILGHPDGIVRSADMGKTWNFVHHGLDSELQYGGILNSVTDRRRVFKIYSSGNVMYAVAGSAGC